MNWLSGSRHHYPLVSLCWIPTVFWTLTDWLFLSHHLQINWSSVSGQTYYGLLRPIWLFHHPTCIPRISSTLICQMVSVPLQRNHWQDLPHTWWMNSLWKFQGRVTYRWGFTELLPFPVCLNCWVVSMHLHTSLYQILRHFNCLIFWYKIISLCKKMRHRQLMSIYQKQQFHIYCIILLFWMMNKCNLMQLVFIYTILGV